MNPANLVGPISRGQVEVLRVLFSHEYPWDSAAGRTFGDHAVQYGQKEVVRFLQELGKPFGARPQFVALVAEDEAALRAALAEADPGEIFNGRTIDYWARQHDKEEMLAAAQALNSKPS